MEFELNIDKAVTLSNKRSTTVDDICKLLFEAIKKYQDSRQDFYVEEFKESREYNPGSALSETADEIAQEISNKVEKDIKKFVPGYVARSIDKVLDAMNEKRFFLMPYQRKDGTLTASIVQQLLSARLVCALIRIWNNYLNEQTLHTN